jgi:hypothetical protein
MPGVGHGGKRKGMLSLERRQNIEASRYYMLEAHIEPPSEAEIEAIKAMVEQQANDPEEAAMFTSMLLGDEA